MPEVLEITSFKLAGRTAEEFTDANRAVDAFLRRQPGFLWRRITQNEDGTIIDIVAFADSDQAQASARGITTELGHSPAHGMIDHAAVDWMIVPVLQHTR
ncbi:hypothetical protein [Longimicrobium sp.]|uniref:hypothetical protein n=1 Tax=Longimicrobium sp. TaxID=2029185 RepID=UPI002E370E8B|nr:hypothetical protein [Longimicrobium sp.]HEX6040327.1 hypothetical protein [Longimicrobium sp.]